MNWSNLRFLAKKMQMEKMKHINKNVFDINEAAFAVHIINIVIRIKSMNLCILQF